jgi:hypothetical protein
MRTIVETSQDQTASSTRLVSFVHTRILIEDSLLPFELSKDVVIRRPTDIERVHIISQLKHHDILGTSAQDLYELDIKQH